MLQLTYNYADNLQRVENWSKSQDEKFKKIQVQNVLHIQHSIAKIHPW